MQAVPHITLSHGGAMPTLGLGVFEVSPGAATQQAVEWALEAGYRHIDTARLYGNEQDVGHAIRESGVPRSDIFVTTKLRNEDHGFEAALRACEASLIRLGLEALDLYLIHWPVAALRHDSWDALVELRERGLCRAIGVSNYTVRHLRELIAFSDVLPAVNQFECHPFLAQRELRAFCAEHGIVCEAYSPLTRGERLAHPTLVEVARELDRSAAQVLIRWALQHGMAVLPKSSRRERIIENAQVFDFALSDAQMARLDALDEGLHTTWDPTHAP